MNYLVFNKYTLWILRFLKLQLFISLFAMPILLWWGLPLSILSPIGNLIFGPILTLFLMLSSLLFFFELLHIPNGAIAWCLDTLTKAWLYVIQINGNPWLFGFATPNPLFLLAIPLAALLILHFKKFKHIGQSVLCFALLLIGSCFYIKMIHSKTNAIATIGCNRGELTLLHDKKNLTVIDPGVLGQRISAKSWVEFTLVPQLIKTSGSTTIDTLIVLQPGAMTFQAIATLVTKVKVKTVYLVCWQGSLAKHEWREFFNMKRVLEENHVVLKRIAQHEINIPLSGTSHVTIKPLAKKIKQKEIEFPGIEVFGIIGDQSFQIQSQKLKSTQKKDHHEKESSIDNSKQGLSTC
ncbi:MAG: hypothetical protein P4L31_05200 [Candidatus Babeliales bacterium]|nr:hypothetical protein [Candidatus Babeliales bacterium]